MLFESAWRIEFTVTPFMASSAKERTRLKSEMLPIQPQGPGPDKPFRAHVCPVALLASLFCLLTAACTGSRPTGREGDTPEIPCRSHSLRGVSVCVPTALRAQASASIIPAEPLDFGWPGPEHVRFLFPGYLENKKWKRKAEISIFRKSDFLTQSPGFEEDFRRLKAVMTRTPSSERQPRISFLPDDVTEMFQSRVTVLHSPSEITGVRFLTVYGQEETEVSNARLEYVYLGLNQDDRFYIAAHLPVVVPETYHDQWTRAFGELAWDGPNSTAPGYPSYLTQVKAILERLREDEFEPDLRHLDALVRSVTINQEGHDRF